jgi:hypothetical protein
MVIKHSLKSPQILDKGHLAIRDEGIVLGILMADIQRRGFTRFMLFEWQLIKVPDEFSYSGLS